MNNRLNLNNSGDLMRLADEHQMLLETIQFSPVHFCVYDPQDRLLAWNKAYEANYPDAFEALRDQIAETGVTYADLIRHQLAHTMDPDALEAEVAHRVALQASAAGEPVIRRYKDHVLKVHKYRLPSGAVAGLAVDISDLIQNERKLSEARRAAEQGARAKASFLANMSHEIRTPMNGIIGLTDLLQETALDADQRDLVNTIASSANALMSTINEILDFSKIDAGKLDIVCEPFDLNVVLNDLADLMRPVAEQKDLRLNIRFSRTEPHWYLGDPLRIRQCLLNLVGNALKFTLEGSVSLEIRRQTSGEIRFQVKDTGIGIAPEHVSKIFTAFEQADSRSARLFEGTGLGLAITRRLVELMGGRVAVESVQNEGSTFTFWLPLEDTAAAEKALSQQTTEVLDLAGVDILIAEDNQTNRMVIERMLRPTGAAVRFAHDGEEAVAEARRIRPDLILMDISMPRLNGLDATRAIRQHEAQSKDPRVPIASLTANAMQEDHQKCLDAGMDMMLTKPVRKTELMATLQEMMILARQ